MRLQAVVDQRNEELAEELDKRQAGLRRLQGTAEEAMQKAEAARERERAARAEQARKVQEARLAEQERLKRQQEVAERKKLRRVAESDAATQAFLQHNGALNGDLRMCAGNADVDRSRTRLVGI